MVTIEYNGYNTQVLAAAKQVNYLFNYEPFLNAIKTNHLFDLANVSPTKIADMIANTDIKLSINLYWPLKLSNRAHAYDDVTNPQILHMNKITLNRPIHSLCNTMVHQAVHAVNYTNSHVYFGHGDNNPCGKCNTAPYWIAGLAQKMIANDDGVFEQMTHEDVKDIPRIEAQTNKQMQLELIEAGLLCFHDQMAVLQA